MDLVAKKPLNYYCFADMKRAGAIQQVIDMINILLWMYSIIPNELFSRYTNLNHIVKWKVICLQLCSSYYCIMAAV